MNISGRAGHNEIAKGAIGILDEVTEDRKIFAASKKYLSVKHKFTDCTPVPIGNIHEDLMSGISKSNSNNADIFYSVHLNKAYTHYDGAIGAEIYLYNSNSKLLKTAERILDNLEKLGFKNRGVKFKTSYLELNKTKAPSMIIECFFLEATKDVELYRKLGPDKIGLAIANGIDSTINIINAPKVENKIYRVQVGAFSNKTNAENLLKELKNKGYTGFIV